MPRVPRRQTRERHGAPDGPVTVSLIRVRILSIIAALGLATLGSAVTAADPARVSAAVPSFVQSNANRVTGGTTDAVAFPSANTAGNLIVVTVMWTNNGTVSLADTRGN